ncbi:MAG: phosphoenolpyruvate synthase, partial [Methanobacteriota archaeon]
MKDYLIPLSERKEQSILEVGGKTQSLLHLRNNLHGIDVDMPGGFVLTTMAFVKYLNENHLGTAVSDIIGELDENQFLNLAHIGAELRKILLKGVFSKEVEEQVHDKLMVGKNKRFAVRSSATCEDLEDASFAGMHDSFLNVKPSQVLEKIRQCYASLYSDRAIRYRIEHGFEDARMAVIVQEMADVHASGVAFTIEPESGFKDVVVIEAAWGLGEATVGGKTDPDEYVVYKPKLLEGKTPIIGKRLGRKKVKTILQGDGTLEVDTSKDERSAFTLTDLQVLELSKVLIKIEQLYGKPMDVEWSMSSNGKFSILQARPITTQKKTENTLKTYKLIEKGHVITEGIAVGKKIASGSAKILFSPSEFLSFNEGDVLVTEYTTPEWMPLITKASAVVTDKGGRTSHAAIVTRELGKACIVGTKDATKKIVNDSNVTVCCLEAEGKVYEGILDFTVKEKKTKSVKTQTEVLMNINISEASFNYSNYECDGVGMVREEYLIVNNVGVHPKALLEYEKLRKEYSTMRELAERYDMPDLKKLEDLLQLIEDKTRGYNDLTDYYVETLALNIGKIAASFYPRKVIVKLTDLKTDEYRGIPGGFLYEPEEDNPLIGWRSAVRYYSREYKPVFKLECEALRRVREDMGFTNVQAMIPYIRTPEEAA